MIESELPFDSYKTLQSGIRVRFEHTLWVVNAFEEIRKALKEEREPNFAHLMDRDAQDIYSGVLQMLNPNGKVLSSEEIKALTTPTQKLKKESEDTVIASEVVEEYSQVDSELTVDLPQDTSENDVLTESAVDENLNEVQTESIQVVQSPVEEMQMGEELVEARA